MYSLVINHNPKINNSVKSLVLRLLHKTWKTLFTDLVIVHHAPGPYSEYVSKYFEFLIKFSRKNR